MSDNRQTVLIIITGSISAYKVLQVIRALRKEGVIVIPVLTAAGENFVTRTSVAVLSNHKVYGDFSDLKEGYGIGHIDLARCADLVVVCPASADIIARSACGLSEDLAGAILLANTGSVLIFPAMNPAMWNHPATRDNVSKLRARGVEVRNPVKGYMACGEEGEGRLEDPEDIVKTIMLRLFGKKNQKAQDRHTSKNLEGKHVLVTAGPTRERLDAVRVLTNMSTGMQGYALARAAAHMGARVTLVSGPVDLMDIEGVTICNVESAQDMLYASEQALPADVMIACAAVCDWYVRDVQDMKYPKSQAWQEWVLEPTPDIVRHIAQSEKRPPLLIAFAAETDTKEGMESKARDKMVRKGCDWIVVNDPRNAMGCIHNEIMLIREAETEKWELLDKNEVAKRMMMRIAEALPTEETKLCS